MASGLRVCQCHAKCCIQQTCIDPTSRTVIPGKLLKRAQYQDHQLAEAIWSRNHQEDRLVNAFTSTTLMEVDLSDAAVTAHQGAHSYASSSMVGREDFIGYELNDPVTTFPEHNRSRFQDRSRMENRIPEIQDLGGEVAHSISTSTLFTPSNSHLPSHEDRTRIEIPTPETQYVDGQVGHSISNVTPFTPSNAPSEFARSALHDSAASLQDMQDLLETLTHETNAYEHELLQFTSQPCSYEDPSPSIESLCTIPHNQKLAYHCHILANLARRFASLGEQSSLINQSLHDTISHRLRTHTELLEALIESQWYHEKAKLGYFPDSSQGEGVEVCDSSSFYGLSLDQTPLVVLMSIVTTLVLYLLHGLSREGASFLLQATQLIASASCLAVFATVGQSTSTFDEWVRMWPTDIRTALKTLQLDPSSIQFACCKHCCACYPPPNYPMFCTNKETPSSPPCGARLLCQNRTSRTLAPIRRFIYQPFKSWLARFLSRPGIEDILIQTPRASNGSSRLETDVWDGEALLNFEGPIPGRSYFEAPEAELRLVFGLFIDWFNPFGNRASSTSTSVGAIYMVCMNLPVWQRYRMENIYLVGIIPGPKEPSLHQINHFLAILVRELNAVWHPGVYFTRTAAYKMGRKVRCALIPLICDLPGLRKAAGLAGHSANHLCSFCRIVKGNIHDFQYWTWPRRTLQQHRAQACAWRDASSEAVRECLWNLNPIRWTALLDLPYWDITKYSVLDAMHNLFLGHFRRHCVDIWQMQAPKNQDLDVEEKSRKQMAYHTTEEQEGAIAKAVRALESKSYSRLTDCRRGYLLALAISNEVALPPQPTKKVIAEALLSWYAHHPGANINSPQPHPFPVLDFSNPFPVKREPVLQMHVLREVWLDMAATILPSWMGRAPKRFGATGQGRLKADQWRTACTVHLPVTLIRLWNHLPETAREKQMLRNFIYLVTAVLWATRRSTSNLHRNIVQNNLHSYLTSLVELFGPDVLVTNHHVSLHLVECLKLFGPVHGWWAFPFERYNGILQGFNTNSRVGGELELTIFTSFCRAANFKAFMTSSPIATLLKSFQKLFLRFSGSLSRGTLASDLAAFDARLSEDSTWSIDDQPKKLVDLPSWHYRALLDRINIDSGDHISSSSTIQRQALSCSSISMRGIKFTTFQHSEGDSMIIFKSGEGLPDHSGRIQDIYSHTRASSDGSSLTERFLVVYPLRDLDQDEKRLYDPYRDYPLLGIHLCHDVYETEPVLIKASDIVSHFASCPLRGISDHDFRVVVSLARD